METISQNHKIGRIGFIDLMRAFAILMMVQGHLTDALLSLDLRNPENPIYFTWNFMRGVTAPVFFFASGIIFSLLLIKEEIFGKGYKNPRFVKGIKRAGFLLLVGYSLQISWKFFAFFYTFDFANLTYFFKVHVLHIIGIAIFTISLAYLFFASLKINNWLLFFILGNLVFTLHPYVLQFDWNAYFPILIANYFTRENGSIFTLFPWIGYSLIGASLGILYHKHSKHIDNIFTFSIIIGLGLILHFFSSDILKYLFEVTHWTNFEWLFQNNFIHYRLGHVFIVLGIIGIIAKFIKVPTLITKIGSETLSIYFFHSIIIYGTLTGFGLAQIFKLKSLNGWECLFLAIFVEIIMIIIAAKASSFRKWFFLKKSIYLKKKIL